MKLRWKKQFFNPSILGVILLIPILYFLILGLDMGLLPEFWGKVEVPDGDGSKWVSYFSYMRTHFSFVDTIEFDFTYLQMILPFLSSVTVLFFIEMRDKYLPFASTRLKKARQMEWKWVIQTAFFSGGTLFCGYLLTMLINRILFIPTCWEESIFDVFASCWNWSLSALEHPYLYVLLLGIFRGFLTGVVFSIMTIAISYITSRVYIYLFVPVIYNILACSWFAQGGTADKWPFTLFSPHNWIWPSSSDYLSETVTINGAWGAVAAALLVVVPSIVIIAYRIQKREI